MPEYREPHAGDAIEVRSGSFAECRGTVTQRDQTGIYVRLAGDGFDFRFTDPANLTVIDAPEPAQSGPAFSFGGQ